MALALCHPKICDKFWLWWLTNHMLSTRRKPNLGLACRSKETLPFTKSFESNSQSLSKCDTVFREKLFPGINYVAKPSRAHLWNKFAEEKKKIKHLFSKSPLPLSLSIVHTGNRWSHAHRLHCLQSDLCCIFVCFWQCISFPKLTTEKKKKIPHRLNKWKVDRIK